VDLHNGYGRRGNYIKLSAKYLPLEIKKCDGT